MTGGDEVEPDSSDTRQSQMVGYFNAETDF